MCVCEVECAVCVYVRWSVQCVCVCEVECAGVCVRWSVQVCVCEVECAVCVCV